MSEINWSKLRVDAINKWGKYPNEYWDDRNNPNDRTNYWSIGDILQLIESGSGGGTTYTAGKRIYINNENVIMVKDIVLDFDKDGNITAATNGDTTAATGAVGDKLWLVGAINQTGEIRVIGANGNYVSAQDTTLYSIPVANYNSSDVFALVNTQPTLGTAINFHNVTAAKFKEQSTYANLNLSLGAGTNVTYTTTGDNHNFVGACVVEIAPNLLKFSARLYGEEQPLNTNVKWGTLVLQNTNYKFGTFQIIDQDEGGYGTIAECIDARFVGYTGHTIIKLIKDASSTDTSIGIYISTSEWTNDFNDGGYYFELLIPIVK